MNKTKIEYCDYTWNPVTGCLNKCTYCYARKFAMRFGGSFTLSREEKFLELYGRTDNQFPDKFDPTFHRYRLEEPQHIKKPSTIFVCSMADLFGDWVPLNWIIKVFEACKKAPQHRYLFLTKNQSRYNNLASMTTDNMWFGITVTNDRETFNGFPETFKRAAHYPNASDLHNTFISVEPLLQKLYIGFNRFPPDWVIIGAETGNRKNKVIPERKWIVNIVNECRDRNVKVFMKNNLSAVWEDKLIQELPWEIRK